MAVSYCNLLTMPLLALHHLSQICRQLMAATSSSYLQDRISCCKEDWTPCTQNSIMKSAC